MTEYRKFDDDFLRDTGNLPTRQEAWNGALAHLRREVEADMNRRGGVLFTGADIFSLIDKLKGESV